MSDTVQVRVLAGVDGIPRGAEAEMHRGRAEVLAELGWVAIHDPNLEKAAATEKAAAEAAAAEKAATEKAAAERKKAKEAQGGD